MKNITRMIYIFVPLCFLFIMGFWMGIEHSRWTGLSLSVDKLSFSVEKLSYSVERAIYEKSGERGEELPDVLPRRPSHLSLNRFSLVVRKAPSLISCEPPTSPHAIFTLITDINYAREGPTLDFKTSSLFFTFCFKTWLFRQIAEAVRPWVNLHVINKKKLGGIQWRQLFFI